MSDGGSSNRRETIHVSLGSKVANAVSAHYLNLQGLAATSHTCEAHVTHAKENDYLVPRCLFFDEGETQESVVYDQYKSSEATIPSLPIYSQNANALAYSKYSRYRVQPSESHKNWYSSLSSNSRHVDWGDEEEENDRTDQLRQEELEKEKWNETKHNLQQRLEGRWSSSNDDNELAEATQALKISPEALEKEASLKWDSFLAPPYPSNFRFALPFSSQSKLVDSWDTYSMGSSTRLSQDWKEEVLEESMRLILEDCDSVQGVTIATEGHGVFAGLTTTLLQYLSEESRSAGTLIFNMTEPLLSDKQGQTDRGEGFHVKRLRRCIETGLASFEAGQIADVTLPIQIFKNNGFGDRNTFHTSSQVAMALETATLAYRRNIDCGCTAGTHPFHNSSRLSFGEFLASLKPSSCYKLVGLDFTTTRDLSFLLPGTSVERRQEQQAKQHLAIRQQKVLPGAWIEKKLRSLSTGDNSKCQEHLHWSLSTSIRKTSSASLLDYLECTKEAMGARFRPMISMSTILDQSIQELTADGYAAGAYWKVDPKEAVVSVLSNSTKSYSYAKDIAGDLKKGLSRKFKTFYNRDAMNGVLPEIEDCEEALEYCLSLRDIYQPPNGSCLFDDEEGVYFDENLG